jgi:hypothetical protein
VLIKVIEGVEVLDLSVQLLRAGRPVTLHRKIGLVYAQAIDRC